jgi:hypothetical protein
MVHGSEPHDRHAEAHAVGGDQELLCVGEHQAARCRHRQERHQSETGLPRASAKPAPDQSMDHVEGANSEMQEVLVPG